ncbi:sugar phosphate nucleotidyltransferase [Pseudalkalibacillus sp. SCS-8]|uniref:sugar phosphate nucleotidyltransferase n=1 Tax=Pseudalkalibacillus nanhaiensis TaxID=3115291 RepID=UPI0032DA9473
MKRYGIIPSAGLGSRLSPLAFSKEMFPIGYQIHEGELRPCPLSQYLVESMMKADIRNVFMIISPSKTDILSYYQNGDRFNMDLSYLIQPHPKGMVDALAQATPWLPEEETFMITFGMPDTFFQPSTLYSSLIHYMENHSNVDIVLGVFPTKSWHKLGMVMLNEEKERIQVTDIIDKPKIKPDTDYAWGAAVWNANFQQFLTAYSKDYSDEKELALGNVFLAAMEKGYEIDAIKGELYYDLGTVEDLSEAINLLNQGKGEAYGD